MTLVIMAAGMGSRYGGYKQIDPVGPGGEFIVDYSVYDAREAGFDKVVFIIKQEHRRDFEDTLGKRIRGIDVSFAYQSLQDIPSGFTVPDGRVKPWGTGHAVLCAMKEVNDNFMVINADDFYGRESFALVADYMKDGGNGDFCMVGFGLDKTVTQHGSVSRGICETSEDSYLTNIVERTRIVCDGGDIRYFADEDGAWHSIDGATTVSMNCWGFTPKLFGELESSFRQFLSDGDESLKKELYLPFVVREMMSRGKCDVKVLKTVSKWYGVTYKEDRGAVVSYLDEMMRNGTYPQKLWGE